MFVLAKSNQLKHNVFHFDIVTSLQATENRLYSGTGLWFSK